MQIQNRLNIGFDTIVLVDDQEFERDGVRFSHPDIEAVDAYDYLDLATAPRLSPEVVTEDARCRRLMYIENAAREESEQAYEGPKDEFLASLGIVFRISRAQGQDLHRLEELTQRTNQLNSTGINYSLEDLERLKDDPAHDLSVCELVDRYGSYGKIGMALVSKVDTEWTIELLLMSCRTLSKGAGTVLLTFLMQWAAERHARLFARFRRTSRNRQMLLAYQLANFEVVSRDGDDHIYGNDLTVVPEYPEYIQIDINHGDGDKEAVQVLGANGCWEGYPVERLYREAKILQIIEGTNEMQQMLLAGHALKTFSAGPTPTPTDFTRRRGFSGTPR